MEWSREGQRRGERGVEQWRGEERRKNRLNLTDTSLLAH